MHCRFDMFSSYTIAHALLQNPAVFVKGYKLNNCKMQKMRLTT